MPEEKKRPVIRHIKTISEAKGLTGLKTRPRTETEVMYMHMPPRTIRNLKRGGLTKGIRDIQRIGKKIWELEVAESLHVRAKQEKDKASALYDALDRVNAAMAQVRAEQEKTQKFAEELQTSNEEMQATNEEMEASNEELKATTEELERTSEQMQQFASVASHELQEPLRMVASYLQLIEKRYKPRLDKKGKEFIGFAVDGAKRMQTLVNDLLTYSRVTTRAKPFEPTNCEDVLKQVLGDMQVTIKKSHAEVIHGRLPQVSADSQQLGQLFQNLISNAIKFHKKKGRPLVDIGAEKKKNEWVFSVRDNGIGIAPEHQERIFQIFQRLHGKKEYPGTGIGLALCQNIVGRHGGRIWVESKPGKGATFNFTIPIRKEREENRLRSGKPIGS